MEITKEQFKEYTDVQSTGMFNMFDPNARMCTSLTKNEWIDIMKNYDELSDKYEGEDDES